MHVLHREAQRINYLASAQHVSEKMYSLNTIIKFHIRYGLTLAFQTLCHYAIIVM